MKKPKQEQKEYRVVFKEEFHGQFFFSLQSRPVETFFRHGWKEVSESLDVTYLCEQAWRLIALDKANGINSVLLTDEDIYLKERSKK